MSIGTPQALGTPTTGVITTVSTISMILTTAIQAADLVVVGFFLNDANSRTAVSVADSGGNTYTKAATTGLFGSFSEVSLWYKSNAAAVPVNGTNSITVTLSGATAGAAGSTTQIHAARVPGIILVSALDKQNTNTASSGNSVSVSTAALAQQIEIAFGIAGIEVGSAPAYSGASGFTNLDTAAFPTNTGYSAFDFNIVNSLSAVTFVPTWNQTMNRAGAVVATFMGFPVWGFEVQSPQPPHRAPELKGGTLAIGNNGIEAPFISFFPSGWPVQGVQPPSRSNFPNQRAAATTGGDDGIQNPAFFALNRFDFGPAMFYRRRYRMPEFGGPGVGGDEPPFPRPNWNWEPHVGPVARRAPRPGFLAATSLVEVLPPQIDAAAWALDTTELIYRRRPVAAVENEPSFLPLPRAIPWGYDHPESMFLRRRVKPAEMREALIVPRRPDAWGFDQPFQVLRRPPLRLLDRNELIVVPRRAVWGWEVAAPGPFPTLRRRRVLDRGYELVTSFPPTLNSGWAVQPWQPPRFGRNRAAGFMRGDDGAYVPVTKFYPSGWAPVLFWPPHPRPERAGAIMAGDLSGAWGPFVYLVPSGAKATDFAVWLATAYDIGQPPA